MNERVLIQRHFPLPRDHCENFKEVFLVGAVDLDLIEDTTQGRFIEDRVGVEVGREDDKCVKRHFEFLTRLQGQNILVFFEWNNPAVHKRLRRFCLTAKVVHDKDAAGRFQLQWRLIGPGRGVIDKVQHRQ